MEHNTTGKGTDYDKMVPIAYVNPCHAEMWISIFFLKTVSIQISWLLRSQLIRIPTVCHCTCKYLLKNLDLFL